MAKRISKGTSRELVAAAPAPGPELGSEIATRIRDPFEQTYMGVVRTNDPLLLERGQGGSRAFELYRDLLRDGKVFSGLQRRTLAVIGKPWQVTAVEDTPEGERDAEIVTTILKQLNFDTLCSQMLAATVVGFVPAEIIWDIRDNLVVPKQVKKRAQRRFVYVEGEAGQPPQLRLLTQADMLRGEALPDQKFIVHRFNPEDDNPYGMGLGLQLYWPVFFKRKGIVSWNKLCDRLGVPTAWGKYPKNAGPREKNTLMDALKALTSDGAVSTPEGTTIELIESKLTGSITTQQQLCEYMDDWIMEVLLGQSPRGKGGGALAAASNEREDVRVELSQADSDLLSETLNDTLVKWICEFNQLVPCRVYRVIKKDEDLKAASETDKNVAGMGFRMSLDGVKEKYGEHWEEAKPVKPPPAKPGEKLLPPVDGDPANFAEGEDLSGQQAIDAAIAAVPDAELQDAMAGIFAPLLAAVESASTFDDALAAAEMAYPLMNKVKLQALLARAMFGAESFGRATGL